MSLTEEAYRERKWGSFPILRKAIEDKKIPDQYYGWSSVSDNMFDRMARILEIAVLMHEFQNDIVELANSGCAMELHKDLDHIEYILNDARSFFTNAIDHIRKLKFIICQSSIVNNQPPK